MPDTTEKPGTIHGQGTIRQFRIVRPVGGHKAGPRISALPTATGKRLTDKECTGHGE